MTDLSFFIPRSAASAVHEIPKPAEVLGRAALLYLVLLPLASNRGIIIRTRMFLANALAVSEADIDIWLSRLEKAGLVIRQTPPPYLVLKLRFWSGGGGEAAVSGSESRAVQEDVPVSSKQQAAAVFSKSRASGDGVQGEGTELGAAMREVLGESDERVFQEIIIQFPESTIRWALARVRATPERQIRKSKLALFRFLLTKFTTDNDE